MNAEPRPGEALPSDVITALQQGNKVEAIKRLREARGLQLKEAKDLLDAYVRHDPALTRKYTQQASATRRALWWVALAAIVAVWFWKVYG